jgi:hypothetical protein
VCGQKWKKKFPKNFSSFCPIPYKMALIHLRKINFRMEKDSTEVSSGQVMIMLQKMMEKMEQENTKKDQDYKDLTKYIKDEVAGVKKEIVQVIPCRRGNEKIFSNKLPINLSCYFSNSSRYSYCHKNFKCDRTANCNTITGAEIQENVYTRDNI